MVHNEKSISTKKVNSLAINLGVFIGITLLMLLLLEGVIRIIAPQQLVLVRPDIWVPIDGLGHQKAPILDTSVNTGEREIRLLTNEHGHRIGLSQKGRAVKFSLPSSNLGART